MNVLDVIKTTKKRALCREETKEDFLIIETENCEFNIVSLRFGTIVFENPFNTIEKLTTQLEKYLIINNKENEK